MTVLVIKAPAGVGKTTLVIDCIRKAQLKRVEYYVPTIALAQEIQTKLRALEISTCIIQGRSRELEPGHTLCQKPILADAIAKRGFPVFPVICMGQRNPGDRFSFAACEYFTACEYLKQFASDARVVLYTHSYLPLPRNKQETIPPSLVIIDESFWSTCIQRYDIPRGRLLDPDECPPTTAPVVSALLAAFDARTPLLDALRTADITPAILATACAAVAASGASFNPYRTDDELLENLTDTPRARLDLLFEVLAAELATPRSESQGVTFNSDKQILTVHYRKPISRFSYRDCSPDIIFIDANADPELVRPWFPDITFHEITAERNAYVIQCLSARGATISFVPARNDSLESKVRATKSLEGLQALIDREAEGGEKKVLVVGPQVITGNQAAEVPPLLRCPLNGVLAHFNGLRGVDAYKDFHTVIIVGRNQPPISELERLARCLWYDSQTPLSFADDWTTIDRPYRVRKPAKPMGVEVLVHPDPRIQRLHEQIREGESTQAIDRLRLIHATQPKRVIVVSNIPLDLEVDEIVDLQTLLFRSRLDRAWDQLRGVLPLNPKWLSDTFPTLWATSGAARTDLRAGGQCGGILNKVSIKSLTTLDFEYRVAGQHRRSEALSVLSVPDTMNELARLLGVPVAVRRVQGGVPGLEGNTAMGGGSSEPLQAEGIGTAA